VTPAMGATNIFLTRQRRKTWWPWVLFPPLYFSGLQSILENYLGIVLSDPLNGGSLGTLDMSVFPRGRLDRPHRGAFGLAVDHVESCNQKQPVTSASPLASAARTKRTYLGATFPPGRAARCPSLRRRQTEGPRRLQSPPGSRSLPGCVIPPRICVGTLALGY